MDLLTTFAAYEADFEKTVGDDRWTRLEPYFAEDAVYQTYGSTGRRTKGRAAIFRRLRRELDAFDRRCQSRRVRTTQGPEVDGNRVLRSWVVTFHIDGAADLMIEGSERITFEDGRIVMLEEEPSELAERHLLAWIKLNPHVFAVASDTTAATPG
ncbi:MAG TPA: nuclear transport factor 2 family protein [Candidatus Binatia bacterium]|jgi:hypothetical protein